MHDLEKRIAEWRASMRKNTRAEVVEELESHLRESIQRFEEEGMPPADAFRAAAQRLGSGENISAEFAKVDVERWWATKAALFGVIALAMVMAAFVVRKGLRMDAGAQTWLLMSHVLAITLGYGATFITGGLGICYALQRCLGGFSDGRLRGISRDTRAFASIAAALTAIGIVLGMFWAKGAWGRYWDWDAKETGGFCVLMWLILFVAAGRSSFFSARAVMLLGIVGNVVVSAGWFGANGWRGILTSLILLHVVALLIGLAPSRCLRRSGATDQSHD